MIGFVLALSAHAASLEVSPGDDIKAMTASLAPGSEVVFNDGVYTITGNLEWTAMGTADQPIVLRAAADANPIIETSDGWVVARLRNSAFWEIKGLTFRGAEAHFAGTNGYTGLIIENVTDTEITGIHVTQSGGTGVHFGGSNARITFADNEVDTTRAGTGVYVGCGDASCWTQESVYRNNFIHDLGGDYSVGMHFESGTQGVEIAHNVITGNKYRGLQVESTEHGPQNLVHGNAIWAVGDVGLGVYGSALVRNNLVFDVIGRGIRSNRDGERPFEDVVITHNTVVNTTDWGVDLASWGGTSGMVLANNVVANPVGRSFRVERPAEGGMDASAYLSGNVFSGYVEGLDVLLYPTAYTPGAGFEDFLDAAAWDFYPRLDSTLIDAADASGNAYVPDEDFNAMPRDGEYPDVGAYEFWSEDVNPGWVVAPGFKTLTDGELPIEHLEGQGCCKKGGDEPAEEALLLLPVAGWFMRRRRRAAV